MRPFDVQLIGGMVLHAGKIAEMKTGEGKTLMATLPVYLNALAGQGVHVVTVNDYLASRDAGWMGSIYRFLGLTVGCIQHGLSDAERKAAYGADVTYGTNNELGFDYLRDNMKFTLESMVQRAHHFAIVDEVDSILVDEARTPLIISGPSEESTDKYYQIDRIIPRLERGEEIEEGDEKYTTGDCLVDEKANTVTLTEEGVEKVEKLLNLKNLYDMENMEVLHGVNQGLRAHHLFKRDVHYLIKDGQVVIVDEFTGRMMPGRRWSDGLHQAVEAKEGVKIERENQTLATITFQNYFRMYEKLAGMTGTADTEATEFGEIYDLDVVVIPTNQPMIREDHQDVVFRTAEEKWGAVVEEIRDCNQRGQPALVGTVSIESSEALSARLKKARIPHVVLNAKYHEREASIVAQAGRKGAVTIATNMAGRGTDIVLGGNFEGLARAEADQEKEPEKFQEALARFRETCARERNEVLAAGGLHILGTERHEARRIDNQLRGRSGRQGDPGSSRFYLSLEDDLMRIFGTDRIKGLMGKLGMEEGEPIESGMVSRAIERAQKQVEARNFEIRKHLLEYDDVMNKQREAIYRLRRDILEGKEGRDYVIGIANDVIASLVDTHCPAKDDASDWNLDRARHRHARLLRPPGARRRRQARRARLGAAARPPPEPGRNAVLRQGDPPRRRPHAPVRARRHAADRRSVVEGPPARARPPQGRHRPARLCPARPQERVQARELRALHRDEGAHRGHQPEDALPARADLAGADGGAAPPARRRRRAPALPDGERSRRRGGERRSTESVRAEAGRAAATREAPDRGAPGRQGGPQRSLPLRLGEEVQEVPRRRIAGGDLVPAQGTAAKIPRPQSALARYPRSSSSFRSLEIACPGMSSRWLSPSTTS